MDPITYYWLRCIGFRITSTNCDNQPHMVYMLDSRMDTALEMSPSVTGNNNWCVWLRSDLAHSRARFCYVRTVEQRSQVMDLIKAIVGCAPTHEERDFTAFELSLADERKECQRRYSEYCRNERWGHVPG